MASAQRYEIAPISFVHTGGTLNLQQMARFGTENNSKYTRIRPGGNLDTKGHALSSAKPRIKFSTQDLTTLFGDVSPVNGLKLTGDGTFRLLEREDCVAFLTGATHVTVVGAGGIVIPVSVEADIQSDDGAMAQCEFIPLGTNSSTTPLTITDGVDLDAAPAAAFTSLLYLGPAYHNSVEIPGLRQASVEFGLTFAESASSPGPYCNKGAFTDRNPVFRFRVAKVDEAAVSNLFISAVSSSFAQYFYASAASTDRTSSASSAHVKFSCTAGAIERNEIAGDAAQDAMVEFIVRPTGQMAVSVASALGA